MRKGQKGKRAKGKKGKMEKGQKDKRTKGQKGKLGTYTIVKDQEKYYLKLEDLKILPMFGE